MNNLMTNNFAQAPMSNMFAGSGGMGQLGGGIAGDMSNNNNNNNSNNGGAGGAGAGGNNGMGGMGSGSPGGGGIPAPLAGELDQLQAAYNRTGDRGSQHHPIAEFLYQLTKMLTDDNVEIIEWVDGRIKVHYPERLEGEVLHKYFRHSKFASFQRQLNYFGFRKIAGKGKMSPCSYVNEAATSDIRSLLLIKRKTNGSAARKAAMAQRNTMQMPPGGGSLDLRANLSALAAGAAAATGGQQVNRLNSQAFNAAALFSHGNPAGVASAGLGQFGSLQQKSFGSNLFLNNENAMQLLMSGQKQPSAEDLMQYQQNMSKTNSAPSIEQLHAQLAASLANRQQNGLQHPHFNHPGASMGAASQALNNNNGGGNINDGGGGGGPASAALNAAGGGGGPASAALSAAGGGAGGAASAALSAAGGAGASLFDSATNLKALVGAGDQEPQRGPGAPGSQSQLGNSAASQALLSGGLPSSLFRDNLSSASFGNLLASSNRLSSLLSLNSFLSRDPSVADLVGVLPQGATAQQQFAASQAASAAAGNNQFGMPRYQ